MWLIDVWTGNVRLGDTDRVADGRTAARLVGALHRRFGGVQVIMPPRNASRDDLAAFDTELAEQRLAIRPI